MRLSARLRMARTAALLLLAGTVASSAWAQAAALQEPEGDRQAVVMENEFWRLSLWPDLGARLMHAVYKSTGHDWIFDKGGLFCNHVAQQTQPGELTDAKYDFQVPGVGPEHAAVRVWRKIDGHGNAAVSGIVFERGLTLQRGDPRLHAIVRLSNDTDAPCSPTP